MGCGIAHVNRVGGVGTGFFCLGNEGVGAVLRFGWFQHGPDIGATQFNVNDRVLNAEETIALFQIDRVQRSVFRAACQKF